VEKKRKKSDKTNPAIVLNKFEFYRGDSFQLILNAAEAQGLPCNAVRLASLLFEQLFY
jgi:hypothetical protein